jgi:hypothetical protein
MSLLHQEELMHCNELAITRGTLSWLAYQMTIG